MALHLFSKLTPDQVKKTWSLLKKNRKTPGALETVEAQGVFSGTRPATLSLRALTIESNVPAAAPGH